MTDIHLMPSKSKEELYSIIEQKETWNKKEVKSIVSKVKTKLGNYNVTTLKVGDILASNALNHPALVLSIKRNKIYAVIMTTNPDTEGVILKCNSRFFDKNYFTSTIINYKVQDSYEVPSFYDNKKDIVELRKKLKEYYKNLFSI